ncbi:hypothetical protein LIER_18962 [Lithospermum erythrorhizon]|uniref:Uncharacterized protein n=1 Tax=Lithospermum erythrorhizon TaxID=34254 RepID=A0AAV3QH60_LITER
MASCMAIGKTVSLAIPVLASIYRGLCLITTACYPSNSGSCGSLSSWVDRNLSVCLLADEEVSSWCTYGEVWWRRPTFVLFTFGGLSVSGRAIPYWAAIRPSRLSPQVLTDDQLDSEEDMAVFLSLRTNMVRYREDAFFVLEAYNPHRFSQLLGFSHASVTFPSASKAHGSCKRYSAWLESVFSAKSIRFTPLGRDKGKSAHCLPSSMVSSSSKPLKKLSLPKDDLVHRDPKHAKWGITRRPGPVIVSPSDVPAAITKDVETATVLTSSELFYICDLFIQSYFLLQLAETVLSSEAHTEVVESDESSDCMVIVVADSGDEA